jgi:hypothetical protein
VVRSGRHYLALTLQLHPPALPRILAYLLSALAEVDIAAR